MGRFSIRPTRIAPRDGQESVWDYPRPPRLEPTRRRLRVVHRGVTIADTVACLRVLETGHPPNYYFPVTDVRSGVLVSEDGSSWCEWKGQARYYAVRVADRLVRHAAWSYPAPSPAYAQLAGMVAIYPALMDACFVDDERVQPQPGAFYGGWITSDVAGPFKGAPGTDRW